MPSEPIRRASSDEEQLASAEDQGSVQDAAEPAAPADAGVIAGQEDADTAEHTIVEPGETEDAGDNVFSTSGPRTIPLPEISVKPLAALEMGTTIGDRYEVVGLLSAGQDTNVYRAIDKQGHLRCWACGSSSSMSGDVYCVECGAQLAGRYYRLQEFMLEADETSQVFPPISQDVLANKVPGIAQVFDTLIDSIASRAYVVWEEVYGRPLSSWLPGAMVPDSLLHEGQSGQLTTLEEPTEETKLLLMAQAAEILAALHTHGMVGCTLELDNLLVEPGGRLVMLDPSGCRLIASDAPEAEKVSAATSDVRSVANQLERWYLSVRADTEDLSHLASHATATEDSSAMVVADETTGPLGEALSISPVLSKAREGAYPTADAFAAALRQIYEGSKPATNVMLWAGAASDVGQVRQINEDSVLVVQVTVLEHAGNLPVGLYVIADGMGGHQNGEVASSIAVRTIGALVQSALIGPLVAGDPVAHDLATCSNLLRHAVLEANRRISDLARERHSDLGTTVTAALVVGNLAAVANVGDSRVYGWHDGQIAPITQDHSLVAQLVAAGQIKADDIYTHPRRNEIYRALGDSRLTEAEVDIYTRRLQPGDALLLCSDGLWDFVRDPAIVGTVNAQENGDPQAICHTLIGQANAAGGEDNISVIFTRVLSSRL